MARLDIPAMFIAAVSLIVSITALFLAIDAKSTPTFSDDIYIYASQYGVNISKFRECVAKENVYNKWLSDAKALGVRGTPTFIVNTRVVEGNRPTYLKEVIEDQLQNPTPNNLSKYISNQDIILGNNSAPVKIIEISSFKCPHCKAFHKSSFKSFEKEYIDSGKVTWVVKIVGDPIKSNAAYCFYLQKPDKWSEYISKLFV